jgi:hypothetical protein
MPQKPMEYIKSIRDLDGSELLFTLLFISGAVCPGALIIWNFSPTFIKDCGILPLLIFSVGLMLPIVSINSLGSIFLIKTKDYKTHEIAFYCVAFASFWTMILVGTPLLISFLFDIGLRLFVWITISVELVFLLWCVFSEKLCRKDKETPR